jgi:hypothetical protein
MLSLVKKYINPTGTSPASRDSNKMFKKSYLEEALEYGCY